MAGYQTRLTTFPQRPYYDDYDVNKKFLQVLFRPGMPVQARELTQMQTMLQDQISRMGGHFFDNGSKIIGGETSVKERIEYIKLPAFLPYSSNYEYIGGTITNGTLVGNITHYVPSDTVDPATIYVEYKSAEGDITTFKHSGIYKIDITNIGFGYSGNVTVGFSGGGGTGAAAVATISGGRIDTIVITNRGTGYTSAPTVNLSAPAGVGAVQATAVATLITDEATITVLNTETKLNESYTFSISTDEGTTGYGALVSINDGIYFINGRFVVVDKQALVVSKYVDVTLNGNELPVGFLINESIVTPEQDNSLYDNAVGSTNESAPGATRYKMEVTLSTKPTDESVKNFIQIMVLKSGVASNPISQTDYTPIFLEMFARRTYDEAGDFIVNDFLLDVKEHLDTGSNGGKFLGPDGGQEPLVSLTLDPGKAYVRGYEVETTGPTNKVLDKSRDIEFAKDIFISNPYSNYIYVNLTPGAAFGTGHTTTTDAFSHNDRSIVTHLKNNTNQIIFTTILMGVEPVVGDIYKLYYTQLTPTTTSSKVIDISYIFQSGKVAELISPAVGVSPVSANSANSKLLYGIPLSHVKNITSTVFRSFKKQTGTVMGVNITLPPDSSLQYVSDPSAYTISITGQGYIRPLSVTISPSGSCTLQMPADYTGAGVNYVIWANVGRKLYTPRLKTELNQIDLYTFTNNNTIRDFQLSQTDIMRINEIKIDGIDYTNSYELDNGQRDSMYAYGRIKLKAGAFIPTAGTIGVNYQYFSHGSGDFFTVDSYSALAYKDIPTYNGIFLANVIDMRFSEYSGAPMPLVVPNTDIIMDYSYYLARKDIIVLDNKQNFTVVRGVPSLSPRLPKNVDNTITLYELSIPAYTFKSSDINVQKLNYKRFTMKDIANLEKRIESLEYYTQLSLLESDIQGKEFLDKFKNGFIVDNFESLTTGDVENELHTVALDFTKGEMRAESVTSAVNVVTKTLTNCVSNNGFITLPFTQTAYQSQSLASTTIRIQPFAKFNWTGKVRLNPSFDNWISYTQAPDLTLDAGFFPTSSRASVLNQKIWDVAARVFVGNEVSNNASGNVSINAGGVSSVNEVAGTGRARIWGGELGVSSVTSQTNYVGTRVVDIGAVPYIRSRWVEFTVTGLKPNAIVTPYFDGVNVSTYCFAELPPTYYGKYWHWFYYRTSWVNQATSGSQDVFKANGAGVVHGWFNIPNNESVKFKTGTRKFQVADVLENPSTIAEGYYVANGTNITMQNVFVTTRFVTRESFWYDPVAQSFEVSNPEGVFATSADLFFGPEAADTPDWVTVQIRNMVNGYPGEHVVATVDHYVNEGSFDATKSVNFFFGAPVYLEPKKEYALVVITDSTDLSVWASELGQKSVRPGDTTNFSGEYINKQPYLGSLFKSQNNKTWTAEQTQDMKFVLNRAKFTVTDSAVATFANKLELNDVESEANIFKKVLDDNPLSIAFGVRFTLTDGGSGYTAAPTVAVDNAGAGGSGAAAIAILGTNIGVDDDKVVAISMTSNGTGYTSAPVVTLVGASTTPATVLSEYFTGKRVYVRHPNHGFKGGDIVRLSFPPLVVSGGGPILGGYNVSDLHGIHNVVGADLDVYTFDVVTGSNTATVDAGGGSGIVASQIVPYSYVRIMTDAIVLNGTNMNWKLQSKDYVSRVMDSYENGIIEGKMIDLGALKVVGGDDDYSLQLKSYFGTTTDYLSPLIDEQRVTVYTTTNRITWHNDANRDSNGNEYYTKNDSYARYATKNITLVNPSNELQVYIDLNLVTGTKVNVYCMVASEPVSVSNTNYEWNLMTLADGGNFTDINQFKEAKWVFDSSTDFTNFVIKVCLSSTVTPYVDNKFRTVTPRCKRFRAIALKK